MRTVSNSAVYGVLLVQTISLLSTSNVSAFLSNHQRMTMVQPQPQVAAVQRTNIDYSLRMAPNEVRSGFALPDLRNLFTMASTSTEETMGTNKQNFLQSLDKLDTLNKASNERTSLLNRMITEKVITTDLNGKINNDDEGIVVPTLSLDKPGSDSTFSAVAPGTWKVIYAPHMTTISGFFGGNFDVQYTLYENGQIISHARYDFPIVGQGYLSVSGTYGSVDDIVSRVDFDEAWVKPLIGESKELDDGPYADLNEVPSGLVKDVINRIGKLAFVDAVAVFPVSFLDDDMIVFDFDLLGTRICAKKI